MRQFVAYANKGPSRKVYPLLLNIQSDLITDTESRLSVPLFPFKGGRSPAISDLSPVIDVDGSKYVLLMPLMAGINIEQLGKPVADVSHERATILAALDLLISGI
jgi:toxin CcdB